MAELQAKSPCAGHLPLKIGKVELSEVRRDAITSVAPFRDRQAEVSDLLKSRIGAEFPDPNRMTGEDGARIVWSGRGQCLVLGPAPGPIEGAATTDQTDAWACVSLDGEGARDVLFRLVPIDLRLVAFAVGDAAKTLMGHMPAVLMRTGEEQYGIMVYRSMVATLVHELKTAMETVAART